MRPEQGREPQLVKSSGIDSPDAKLRRKIAGATAIIVALGVGGHHLYHNSETFRGGVDILVGFLQERIASIGVDDVRAISRN